MTETPTFTVREYEPGDEVAILEAFNRIFAAVDPGFRPRTLEFWRWQYLSNPTGWRIYLCVTDDGKVASQYAGVPIPIELEGEPAHFVQSVDSFSDAAYKRGLRKPGIFVVTGYPYAANYGGPAPDRTPVMYGLPVRPAWRIGKKFLEYKLMRTQNKLRRSPDALDASGGAGVDIEEVALFPDEVAAVHRRLAAVYPAVTQRTPEHLNWRFDAHPEQSYRIALARAGGELRGYTVFRQGDFDGEAGVGLICDWAVPPGEAAVSAALRGWLRERARAEQCPQLVAMLPDACPDWLDFQRAGMRVEPTRYFITARHYVRKYTMRWLYRNWYYTMADTDLC